MRAIHGLMNQPWWADVISSYAGAKAYQAYRNWRPRKSTWQETV